MLTATHFAGEDAGYIQNRLQELAHKRHHEARCVGHGKLVLRPQNWQGNDMSLLAGEG